MTPTRWPTRTRPSRTTAGSLSSTSALVGSRHSQIQKERHDRDDELHIRIGLLRTALAPLEAVPRHPLWQLPDSFGRALPEGGRFLRARGGFLHPAPYASRPIRYSTP